MSEIDSIKNANSRGVKSVRPGSTVVLLVTIACIILLVVVVENIFRKSFEESLEERGFLTKPLRLEVSGEDGFGELLIGLRTFHYRPQLQNEAVYSDVFYDTDNWRLLRHGYSYRFRQREAGKKKSHYAIRFEQEPRFVAAGDSKLDVSSSVSEVIGDDIAAGAWAQAVVGVDVPASRELLLVLEELNIDSSEVHPRLRGRLRRERFAISDKGKNWFELDHELWTFRPFDANSDAPAYELEDVVIDTRLKRRDPELIRRVETMRKFSNMIGGVRHAVRAPHERAADWAMSLSP